MRDTVGLAPKRLTKRILRKPGVPAISDVRCPAAPSIRQVVFMYQLQLKSELTLVISQYLGQNVPSDDSFGMMDEFSEDQRHVSSVTSQSQHPPPPPWCLAGSGLSVNASGKDEGLTSPWTAGRPRGPVVWRVLSLDSPSSRLFLFKHM